VNQDLFNAIKHFYQHLDGQVRLLVESFPDTEMIMVSDHAMTVTKWHININSFLIENNFQKAPSKSKGAYKFVNYLKFITPVSVRTKLGKISKIRKAYIGVKPFDAKQSMAFCMIIGDWIHGIFINVRERFGGPVPESEIHHLSERIAQTFNSAPESIKHGLFARVKPDFKTDSLKFFQDVILDMPDGYLTTNASKHFVTEVKLPKGPQDIISVAKGPYLCAKAHNPLSVLINNSWKVRATAEKQDLRLIYDHVLAVFDQYH